MSSSGDRLRAARYLIRIEQGAFASRLLTHQGSPGVRTRVMGVLRWQRALDAVLGPRCRRPIDELDVEVRTALRVGLYESVHLGVPHAVATDGAVHLVRRLGKSSAGGLVNAVLRSSVAGARGGPEHSTPDVHLSHPAWLFERWTDHFGSARAEAMMEADQTPAPMWVWFIDEDPRQRMADQELPLQAHPWCPGAWRAPGHEPELVREIQNGSAYAQDPSSQLVAHVGIALVREGGFVDLCAAPGGKAALLGRLGSWDRSVALDLRLQRVRLMRDLVHRVGGCTVAAADGASPPVRQEVFDLVLLDAPCTGTGTLRRHPELKWRLRPESIPERAGVQQSLLSSAFTLVAPGGILLYATCSVEPEENEEHFAGPTEGFDVVDLGKAIPTNVPSLQTDAGGIRILPNLDGDGFTMHALRRVRK